MKTLDEVIETAPYVGTEWTNNALHYLKNYRDTKEWLELEKKNYAEAVKNCERAESKYTKLVWDMNRNDPLTWDELKQMEGKPVWIELLDKGHWKGWDVICGFDVDDFGDAMCTIRGDDYYLTDLDKIWQAYRKERE